MSEYIADTNRIKKVNRLVQEELGKIIVEEAVAPKGSIITITKVDVSIDIKHARVYIAMIPKNKSLSGLKSLQDNVYRMQKILNKRLVLKFVPKISFTLDDTSEKVERIEEILRKNE